MSIANIYGVVTIGQAMIFCHTRKTAAWLVEKMTKDGHAVALLSGELTVEERIQVGAIQIHNTRDYLVIKKVFIIISDTFPKSARRN